MIQGEPGPPTEQTLANIKRARVWSVRLGPTEVSLKLWTGSFYIVPWREEGIEERYGAPFRDEGKVSWRRWYWLTCGYYRVKHLDRRGKHGDLETQ